MLDKVSLTPENAIQEEELGGISSFTCVKVHSHERQRLRLRLRLRLRQDDNIVSMRTLCQTQRMAILLCV